MKIPYAAHMVLATYVGLFVGMAIASVGRMPRHEEPFDWWLPLSVFCLLLVPAILGYVIGRSGASDAVRAKYELVESGFDNMRTLTGNGIGGKNGRSS